jgi:hypothetical protein
MLGESADLRDDGAKGAQFDAHVEAAQWILVAALCLVSTHYLIFRWVARPRAAARCCFELCWCCSQRRTRNHAAAAAVQPTLKQTAGAVLD